MLIYGSTAIKFWFEDYPHEPKDLDIISKDKNVNIATIRRKDICWEPELEILQKCNKHNLYLDPDLLYTLKMSHLSWDIKWDKHMKDAIFLKEHGAELNILIYKKLTELWSRIHGKKHVKMNVKNEEFFKTNIKRKYNHEFLHDCFSYYSKPLNEKIRKDLNSPLCSEELWNNLSFDDKIKCSREELMVLTTERFVFTDNPLPIKFAKIKMLKQMITSTTSGWFNLFLKENFQDLIKDFPEFYYVKLRELKNAI